MTESGIINETISRIPSKANAQTESPRTRMNRAKLVKKIWSSPERFPRISYKMLERDASTGQRNRTTLCDRCNNEFISNVVHPAIDTDRLQSDSVPSDAEHSQALTSLEAEERDLACYEEELARLYRIVHKLETEKSALQKRIFERRSWTSAIRKFPHEIWRLIFEEACLSHSYTLDIPSTSASRRITTLPLIFSRVSSQWRGILYGYPQLWSAISVDILKPTKEADRLVQCFLQRSGTCHLKLNIGDSTGGIMDHRLEKYLGRYGCSILQRLMEALPRCQELTLGIGGNIFGSVTSLMTCHASFVSLQKLEMNVDIEQDVDWFWDLVQDATKLQHISIPPRNVWPELGTNTKIPYHQLTSIHFRNPLKSVVLHALRHYWNDSFSWDVDAGALPVLAHNLQSLYLDSSQVSHLRTLFTSITLPAITSITIEDLFGLDVGDIWEALPALSDMLERSRASLKSIALRFAGRGIPMVGLLNILRLSPEVTSLEVSLAYDDGNSGFLGNLLSELTIHDTTVSLAPKLERLCIYELVPSDNWNYVPSRVAQELVNLAESRSASARSGTYQAQVRASLAELQVSFSRTWRYETYHKDHPLAFDVDHLEERWRALQQSGMRCTVLWKRSTVEE
ncbi:hypothetical protein VNI00_009002 [Paramarasmius palmivorus]|uniref:F-box domain-containing protein n=1 Tax=Paramarasmius palmivorus TaxID=297713 RepID=A0AAW0CSE3_9AGAR